MHVWASVGAAEEAAGLADDSLIGRFHPTQPRDSLGVAAQGLQESSCHQQGCSQFHSTLAETLTGAASSV